MGFITRMKDMVGLNFDDELLDDDYDEEYGYEKEETLTKKRSKDYTDYFNRSENRSSLPMDKDNVVSIQGTKSNRVRIISVAPKAYDECPGIVDNLRARIPVVVNLENLDDHLTRKVFDFLVGATYALGGMMTKISNNIFIFSPDNISVDGDNARKAYDYQDITSRWA